MTMAFRFDYVGESDGEKIWQIMERDGGGDYEESGYYVHRHAFGWSLSGINTNQSLGQSRDMPEAKAVIAMVAARADLEGFDPSKAVFDLTNKNGEQYFGNGRCFIWRGYPCSVYKGDVVCECGDCVGSPYRFMWSAERDNLNADRIIWRVMYFDALICNDWVETVFEARRWFNEKKWKGGQWALWDRREKVWLTPPCGTVLADSMLLFEDKVEGEWLGGVSELKRNGGLC